MYRVVFIKNASNNVGIKEFDTFAEAVEFCNKQPINSVLEVKHYDVEDKEKLNK